MDMPKLPGEDLINSWYPILFALTCGLLYGLRSYFKGPQCPSQERLTGKVVIVTGANSGVGKEVTRELASRGARVIMACRDLEKANEAIKEISITTKVDKLTVKKLDLSSLASVRAFVEDLNEEEKIDILVNNAGVMCYPDTKTEDGLEYHFSVNYAGHFLLTLLLLPKLKAAGKARVVNVTALAARLGVLDFDDLQVEKKPYVPGDAYAQSKLAVVLSTRRLAKELDGTGVTVNVLNPGVVNSNAHRHMPFRQSAFISCAFTPFTWLLMKASKDGAQTPIYVAVAKEEDGVTGKYYSDCTMLDYPEATWKDDKAGDKLWDITCKLIGVENPKLKDS